jgi:hypothetical protein
MTIDSTGRFYFSTDLTHTIYRIPAGGTSASLFMSADTAKCSSPFGLTADSSNNIYAACSSSSKIDI